jgi:DNA-directed RNA polymerase subunit RPC12/RpoP
MSDEFIRFCPYCKLQYSPDERIHKNANERCPKCGHKLIPEQEDEDND